MSIKDYSISQLKRLLAISKDCPWYKKLYHGLMRYFDSFFCALRWFDIEESNLVIIRERHLKSKYYYNCPCMDRKVIKSVIRLKTYNNEL